MAPSITLWQAIDTWLSGQEIDRNAILWGLDVTWWSRISKMGQFIAAGTALIDILGVKKIEEWSRAAVGQQGLLYRWAIFIATVLALSFLVVSPIASRYLPDLFARSNVTFAFLGFVLVSSIVMAVVINLVGTGIRIGLRSPRPARFIRIGAFLLFGVSFSLDLLTS